MDGLSACMRMFFCQAVGTGSSRNCSTRPSGGLVRSGLRVFWQADRAVPLHLTVRFLSSALEHFPDGANEPVGVRQRHPSIRSAAGVLCRKSWARPMALQLSTGRSSDRSGASAGEEGFKMCMNTPDRHACDVSRARETHGESRREINHSIGMGQFFAR